jgi:hypothetical protein
VTPNEFKAWFDGFTEAFENRIPTKAQWTRIKDRVAEIDGKSITERVYVDRYWPQYYPYTARPVYYGMNSSSTAAYSASNNLLNAQNYQQAAVANQQFNSLNAMNALGRAEAAEVA